MAVTASRVSVTTTATPISTGRGIARNGDASVSVFLGASGVTAAAGFELKAGEWLTLEDEDMFAITAAGTVVVHVMQAG